MLDPASECRSVGGQCLHPAVLEVKKAGEVLFGSDRFLWSWSFSALGRDYPHHISVIKMLLFCSGHHAVSDFENQHTYPTGLRGPPLILLCHAELCGAAQQKVPEAAKQWHQARCGRLSSVPPIRWVLLFNPWPGLTFWRSSTFGKWIRNVSTNCLGSSGIPEQEMACNQRGKTPPRERSRLAIKLRQTARRKSPLKPKISSATKLWKN